MKNIARGIVWLVSRVAQTIVVGAVAVSIIAVPFAIADYNATAGSGLTMASVVISTKHYFANVICDATAGETQCQGVNSSGQASVLEANSASILSAVQAAIPAGTNNIGNVGSISQYPTGAVPITASATGTTAATTATLAATSGKTTYICSSSVRANATAATTVTDTITGIITATLSSLLWVAPAASGVGVDEQIFSPCVPASGTNQTIAVVSGAPGTGGNVTVHATGYQL